MPIVDTEPTPTAWLTHRLPRRFDEYGSDPDTGPRYTIHDILADDARLLAAWHARVVIGDHATNAAAATYLAGWIGGSLAGAIGHALATVDAGFVVDDTVRWHQHPDGWIDRVDLGRPQVLVPAGHPWGDERDVTVVDPQTRRQRVVDGMIELLAPVIEACHRIGRTGRVGLWNEVADGLGLAVAHTAGIPVRDDIIDTLADAVRSPGAPWRATPTLRIAAATSGPTYIGQKGGCCLAYTCGEPDSHESEHDDGHRAYLERFPQQPDQPRYCTTCKFRDPADSEQRQLFWIELRDVG